MKCHHLCLQVQVLITAVLIISSSSAFTLYPACASKKHFTTITTSSSQHSPYKYQYHQKAPPAFTVLFQSAENDNDNDNDNDNNAAPSEAEKLRQKAESLRQQIREMESSLGPTRARANNNAQYIPVSKDPPNEEILNGKSLKNKTVLIVGSNGRLGSMVTRHLLRNHPEVKEVLAAVHYVGEASSRGYGRLSYEVGAEDGVGTIGAAWSEDRNAYFEYSDEMKDYNLNKLRVLPVELLDPEQCKTIMEGVDAVIWCATDFEGNRPRAIASLNVAFLFRAVADPTKGRVEIEGLRNVLGALKQNKQDRMRVNRMSGEASASTSTSSLVDEYDPTSFVLVSAAPEALGNFETPYGEFNGLKRQGEGIVKSEFPSLTHSILQMSQYEDNFVEESLDVKFDSSPQRNGHNEEDEDEAGKVERKKRRINRRDAARAAVGALLDENLVDKVVQVWTDTRG
jgi:hypothetical protein